ncbi:MAG: efflux RND transporter permease subunit [Cyanobacteria bacterium SZAS-4]|nr:efflux RND transporter permease subunit [Cyanobacteria bacterium SZAS-4]
MTARILELLIRQSRAVYLVMLFIVVLGVVSFHSLASDVYPNLAFPRIAVIASVGDMDPDRVLLLVTRPLEEASSQAYRVRWIRSKSIRGASELSIEFQPGTDMTFAWQQVQARIAEVRTSLPAGTTLIVEPVSPAIFPILNYNITSDSMTATDLYNLVRYQIEPRIIQVSGVARAKTQAGKVPEIAVEVDPEKLKSNRLSISDVANGIARTNRLDVLGRVDQHYQQNLVVGPGEATGAADLRNLVISRSGSDPVFLKDIASVSNSYKDPVSIISADGEEGIVLNIFRQPSSNVVAVSDAVTAEIESIEKELPSSVKIRKVYDESLLVRQALSSILDEIGVGIFFITVILFLFLRSWKSTIIAALTIPLCAAASFATMALLGQSLNLMSLGGLAIALGLVIDDAIVIIENIHRQLSAGLAPKQAAIAAVSELAAPVISSTSTTLVVFLPLGLLTGVTGQFFSALTITLASAVAFSLFLALFVIPILCAQWLKAPQHELSIEEARQHEAPEPHHQWYQRLLKSFLELPPFIAVTAAAGILATSALLFGKIGTDFLPSVDEGSYVLDYLMPAGTSLAETDRVCKRIESIIAQTDEVSAWTRRTGAELGLFATQPNTGDILVVLKPHGKRKRTTEEVMDEQRERIAQVVPEAEIELHPILADQLNDLSGSRNPVDVRVFGEDPTAIRSVAEALQEKMRKIKGLVDIALTSQDYSPQFSVHVDPWRAGRLLLSPLDVSDQVKDALLGRVSTQIKEGDKFIDVRVRLPDKVRLDADQIAQLPIFGKNGAMLPLGSLGAVQQVRGTTEIQREHQQRYVAVEASISDRDLGSTIAEVKHVAKEVHVPPGVSVNVGGVYLSQQETFIQLLAVLMLAATLVYLLMVIQFRSVRQPLAIIAVLPLGMLGVELALLFTRTPFNVSSFMGLILLVGLEVKNGIILLEYANRLQSKGRSLQAALIEAGAVRFRPIIMTTLCTLLALIPLWLGHSAGAELHRPLAITVIGGLTFSTLFTRIFVPSFSRLLSDRRTS